MELITTKQASERLRVSQSFLRQLAREGKVPFYKLSERCLRFDVDELHSYMKLVAEGKAPRDVGERKPPAAA